MKITWIDLVVYGLACHRLSVLLSKDDGPFWIFKKLREWLDRRAKQSKALQKSKLHEGVECVWCSSIWFAFPIALYARWRTSLDPSCDAMAYGLLLMLAISSIAICVNSYFTAD